MTATISWGTIQGQEITFPMVVDSMNSATMGFTVPIGPAQALLPGDAFEVLETAPGMAHFIVSLCDYVENPWGDYNEVNLGFLVSRVGDPDENGAFIYRMPVDQAFTCEAGNKVMGFPKVVTRIDVEYTDERASFALWDDGEIALEVSVPRVAVTGDASRSESHSYSYLDGAPYSTPLAMDISTGVVSPDDVEITIGGGVIADELTSLGLPTAPDFCMWGEGLSASFQLGQPV